MDVRDSFKRMMRDDIAPRLRQLGSKGSGVYFSLPHPMLYRLMHFQISGGTQPHTLDFTVNLSLINIAEYEKQWEPWMPKKPTAAVIVPIGRQFRIGALLDGADKWWHIEAGEPTETQAFDVVRLIGDYVVPEFERGSMRGPSMNRQPYDD